MKSRKITENWGKLRKIAENHGKPRKIAENRGNSRKIAEVEFLLIVGLPVNNSTYEYDHCPTSLQTQRISSSL